MSDTRRRRVIYLACPWAPLGGGMFKVTDYLVQYQARAPGDAELRPLDTRGGGSVWWSLLRMPLALLTLLRSRVAGDLAGVHVNMAERASIVRKGIVVVWARCIGAPVLIHLHAAQIHHVYRALPAVLQAVVRWVFSLADDVLVLGDRSMNFVREELRCRPERIHAITNGVPRARLARRLEILQREFQIVFLGNLTERKGVSDLLKALDIVRRTNQGWRAVFAGGGDVEGYRAKTLQMGLGAMVRFHGWARQEEAAELLANADVLVLPSYDEGLPLVILEALANGVAVICTGVGEIPSALVDGRDALFVEPGNVPMLAAALVRLMQQPDLRQLLEAEGSKSFERSFSMEAFFDAVAAAHRRVFGVGASFDAHGRSPGHGS